MAVIRKLEKPEDEVPVEKLVKPSRFGHGGGHDDSNWLISYADMMTLLCVFYIMLFSMAKVNENEFEKVKKEVSKEFHTQYQSPTEDLGRFMTNVLQEAGVQKEAILSSDGVSVSIVFQSTLFFGSLSAEISKEGQKILNGIITNLADKQKKLGKNYKIVVEGHTDSQPVIGGPFPSNWELSSSRATRVVRMFLDKGFVPQNMLAIGYADTQPIASGRNPDGTWNETNLGKNRRVVLRVLLPDVDSIPWSGKVIEDKNAPTSAKAPQVDVASVAAAATGMGEVAKTVAPATTSTVPVAAAPVGGAVISVAAPVVSPTTTIPASTNSHK